MNLKSLFSQKKGLVKIEEILQVNSLSNSSKNHIWDVLAKCIFLKIRDPASSPMHFSASHFILQNPDYEILLERIWTHWFEKPLDEIPNVYDHYYNYINQNYFELKWNEVFDFIQFVLIHLNNPIHLSQALNQTFEEDNIGYRIIDRQVTDIITSEEIESVNKALQSPFQNSNIHLSKALYHLYAKPPDYRNSIKESISAVENVVKLITNNPSGSLGDALKKIDKQNDMHKSFKDALNKLYGYTSGADGIRHALMEEEKLTHVDAKLFLIQCSAFVNYLKEKYGR